MKIRKTVGYVAAGALGLAVGIFLAPGEKGAPVESANPSPVPAAKIADAGAESSARALRARVADLERQLAEARQAATAAVTNAAARPQGPEGRGDPRSRLEELKRNDPARYAQITNRMARWRAHRAERAQARMDFLSSIDVSRLSEAARATHRNLQKALARRESVAARLNDESLSEADRRALFDEMRQTDHEIRRLNGEERGNLLNETVRSLGFEGDDAAEIAQTIQDVVDATASEHHGPPGPPPGGGPGGGPGLGR